MLRASGRLVVTMCALAHACLCTSPCVCVSPHRTIAAAHGPQRGAFRHLHNIYLRLGNTVRYPLARGAQDGRARLPLRPALFLELPARAAVAPFDRFYYPHADIPTSIRAVLCLPVIHVSCFVPLADACRVLLRTSYLHVLRASCYYYDNYCVCACVQSKKAAAAVDKVATEVVKLGPVVKEGEIVFGVCHIYASFNDTFVVCKRACVDVYECRHTCEPVCHAHVRVLFG